MCAENGARVDQLHLGEIYRIANGPKLFAPTDDDECGAAIWELTDSGWVQRTPHNPQLRTEPVTVTGIPSGLVSIGDDAVTLAPAKSALVHGIALARRATWAPTNDLLSTWMQPFLGAGKLPDGKAWIMARSYGDERSDGPVQASILKQLPDGSWQRQIRFSLPTGMVIARGGSTAVASACDGIYTSTTPQGTLIDSNMEWTPRSQGVATYSHEEGGCVITSVGPDEPIHNRLGFIHAVATDDRNPDGVLVAQSLYDANNRWHSMISRVDLRDGTTSQVPGLDFTDRDLIPVGVNSSNHGKICVTTVGAKGPGPMYVAVDGVIRPVQVPPGVAANACLWHKNQLIITDSNSGDTLALSSADRRTQF